MKNVVCVHKKTGTIQVVRDLTADAAEELAVAFRQDREIRAWHDALNDAIALGTVHANALPEPCLQAISDGSALEKISLEKGFFLEPAFLLKYGNYKFDLARGRFRTSSVVQVVNGNEHSYHGGWLLCGPPMPRSDFSQVEVV